MHTNKNLFWLLLTPAFGKGGEVEDTAEIKDLTLHLQIGHPGAGPLALRMHLSKFCEAKAKAYG